MKILLLFAALLGVGSLAPSYAQQLPIPAPSSQPTLTHADSLATLHKMFRYNRRAGRYLGLLEGALLPSIVVSAANPDPAKGSFVAGSQVVSAALIIGYSVGSVVRWARYSQRREREAVERFEQRAAQPRYVQHRFDRALLLAARPPHKSLLNRLEH